MSPRENSQFALKFEGVSRYFGRRPAVHDVRLTLEHGSKTAMLGANGSGKTTLLRLAAGILRPTSGEVATSKFAYCPQDAPVYPELTAAEHLQWSSRMYRRVADTEALGKLAGRPAGQLSRGQRQRLHLEMALQSGAQILLLDEPFAPLDEAAARWLSDKITTYSGAVLFSVHDVEQAKLVAPQFIDLDASTIEVQTW